MKSKICPICKRYTEYLGKTVKIKDTWEGAGRVGVCLSEPVGGSQKWVCVRFEDSDEPDLYKLACLESING